MTPDAPNGRHALIIGGGVGGLATGLALARRGLSIDLFERSEEFKEVGAGIQLGPNSVRALAALGVEAETARLAVYPDALVMMDAIDGRQVARVETGQRFRERFGAPYGLIHRADLHRTLLKALQMQPGVRLHQGAAVSHIRQSETAVELEAPAGRFEGDVLIGADGLWSKVREAVVGDGPPRRSGHIAYRAVLPTEQVPEHLRRNEMVLWGGPKCHLVHYPLRGGEAFNLVAVFHSERFEEGWDVQADPAELHARFAGVHADVLTMLGKIEQWRMWVLCDREPVADWSRGRMAVMGDAAHPMLQYLAQGAGMALEDAVELGARLSDRAVPVDEALRTYAGRRYLRTGRAQLSARLYGEFYHADGVRRELRNNFLAAGMNPEGLAWLYDPLSWPIEI